MNKPLIIIGAGGHAAVLVDILRQQNCEIAAVISPEQKLTNKVFDGLHHLQRDDDILQYASEEVLLVNGIGSVPIKTQGKPSSIPLRIKIYQHFKSLGYQFATVVSRRAIISPYAMLAEGVQVMPNVVIQVGAYIGDNSIINTAAVIEHDCQIAKHNHIAPGVTISGDVTTGENVHIGTGASVIQGINIGEASIIGAGAIVSKNLAANKILYPARSIDQ